MFLHRGMIEAAKTEGEVAGVMAHEISHVALRHGTAQATKAQKFQIGAIAGQILGAIVGGAAGSVIAQGSQFGLGAYFLKYGREYEREADLLGAQIMARAGYDPRRMADMFRTIEQAEQAGRAGVAEQPPQPGESLRGDPAGSRDAAHRRLRAVAGGVPASSPGLARHVARLHGGADRARQSAAAGACPAASRRQRRDDAPVRAPATSASRRRPASISASPSATSCGCRCRRTGARCSGEQQRDVCARRRDYRGNNGSTGFTHGLQIGVIPNESHSHQEATEELIDSLMQGNPQIRRQNNGYVRENIGGRNALTTTLRNVSEVTGGAEIVTVTTVPLRDGSLLYLIAVVPQEESGEYSAAFRRVKQTVELSDR